MALTRVQILAADDLTRKSVDVPEWGGEVFVRSLTAGQREHLENTWLGKADRSDFRAGLCSLTVCDEKGVLLFSEADIQALAAKSAAALIRIFQAAMVLNGFRPADVEQIEKAPVEPETA